MLDFLFLGLGVWKDGLFSLAVPFFFFGVVFYPLGLFCWVSGFDA